jgi:hypothetical protein
MTIKRAVRRAEPITFNRWPVVALPGASIYGMIGVQALLGAWTARERNALLASTPPGSPRRWDQILSSAHKTRVSHFFKLRPEELKRSCTVRSHYPKGLDSALQNPGRRIRFCVCCMREGHHSTLFQVPWLRACPMHPGALIRDQCTCGHAWSPVIPIDPSRMLVCPHCNARLCDEGAALGLDATEPACDTRAKWQAVLADHERWIRDIDASGAIASAYFSSLEMRFDSLLISLMIELAELVPPAPAIAAALFTRRDAPSGPVWRNWRDVDATPLHQVLGHETVAAMGEKCAQYYFALPVADSTLAALTKAFNRLRRCRNVDAIGSDLPPSSRHVDLCGGTEERTRRWFWNGKSTHPALLMSFRMFTQMVDVTNVGGHSYIDYPNHSFREAPAVATANWIARNWGTFWLTKRAFHRTKVEEVTPAIPGRLAAWFWDRLIAYSWFESIGELDHRILTTGYVGCRRMSYKNESEQYDQPMALQMLSEGEWANRRCEPWAAGARGESWGCIVLRDARRDRWTTMIGRTDSGRLQRNSGGRWIAPQVVEPFFNDYRFYRRGP